MIFLIPTQGMTQIISFIMHKKVSPTLRFCIDFESTYVGNIGLYPQEDVYRKSAEIGYFIGEEYWGNGIGSKAVHLMVKYGFEELNLHRIFAGVFSFNTPSKRVLEKAGFQYEGTNKDAIFKNGKFYDELRYAIINPNQ